MKRYAIFMFTNYYPHGGTSDLKGFVDDSKGFLELIEREYDDVDAYMVNVLDMSTGKTYPEEHSSYEDGYDIQDSDIDYDEEVVKNICKEVFMLPSIAL